MTLQCTMKAEHGSVFELIQNIHPEYFGENPTYKGTTL